jgi:hypothetical protein
MVLSVHINRGMHNQLEFNDFLSQAWWYTDHGILRQEDGEFKASVDYTARSCRKGREGKREREREKLRVLYRMPI